LDWACITVELRRFFAVAPDRCYADAAWVGLDADPNAEPIYERFGSRRVGWSPSGSIPGRRLPRMERVL
jgi:hypothetical protein